MQGARQARQLAEFRKYLEDRKFSQPAIVHYVGAVRLGLETGDILAALRRARSQSAAKLARAGLLAYAQSIGDRKLLEQIPAVPYLPALPRPQPRVTAADVGRLEQAAEQLDRSAQLAVRLLLRLPIRIGQGLALDRAGVGSYRHLPAARAALAVPSWTRVADLLAGSPQASYFAFRRFLRELCDELGLPAFRPDEFRRLAQQQIEEKHG